MRTHLKGLIHMYLLLHYYKRYEEKIAANGIDKTNIDENCFNNLELF